MFDACITRNKFDDRTSSEESIENGGEGGGRPGHLRAFRMASKFVQQGILPNSQVSVNGRIGAGQSGTTERHD